MGRVDGEVKGKTQRKGQDKRQAEAWNGAGQQFGGGWGVCRGLAGKGHLTRIDGLISGVTLDSYKWRTGLIS
jgi:hypothetical protein